LASHLAKRRCRGKYPSPVGSSEQLASAQSTFDALRSKRETVFSSNYLSTAAGPRRDTSSECYRLFWFCLPFSCGRNFLPEENELDKRLRQRATDLQCGSECMESRWFFRATNRLKMVEAGGVEPPSEKRYDTKPTCLSQFGVRPGPCGMVARSPAALGMSKMRNQLVRWFSPEPYGPKGQGQLTV
jgi:hypothetical protein